MGRLRDDLGEVGVEVVETHISWVFLADRDVWKVKKPVALGFLDFSTPQKRRVACEAEVRLNRRLARGGVVVRTGLPSGWGRLTSQIPLAVAGDAPVRITANGHGTRNHHLYGDLKVRHSPGGILDVAIHVERRDHRNEIS